VVFENTEDYFETRIGLHDSNRFEVKLDYVLNPEHKANRYRVEAFFFIPTTFGISEDNYRSTAFYNDVQAHIRFKTPAISLSALARTDDNVLMAEIEDSLSKVRRKPREHLELQRNIEHDLRLVGAIARRHLRDQVLELKTKVEQVDNNKRKAVLREDLLAIGERLLRDIERFCKRYRAMRSKFLDGQVHSDRLEAAYLWVDEYISMAIELFLTRLIQAIDKYPPVRELLSDFRGRCSGVILAERNYRGNANYGSVIGGGVANDHFVYHRSRLKKFVSSVLWLAIDKGKDGKRWSDLIAGVAAGLAMFFALVMTIWQMQWLATNTWGFVFAGTATYIFKDRIKDWLKGAFSKHMTRFLYDYHVKIRDPVTNLQIGHCREAFSFVSESKMPHQIWHCRHRNAASTTEIMSKPEVVFKYEKAVQLNGQALTARLRQTHHDVNDIIRFDVSRFLFRLADPIEIVPQLDEETGEVVDLPMPRVYHMNLILRMTAEDARDNAIIEHVRVILNKEGIRAVEVQPL